MADPIAKSYFPSQTVSDAEKISYEYELEYGKDTLEVNINLEKKRIILIRKR